MLFALMSFFALNPVFADSFFVAPNNSLMCTYDDLNADENSTVVFTARWCQECTEIATKTTSCSLSVDETTGTCTYTADCKNGYENITEVNTANVHCAPHPYRINYYNLYNGVNDSSNPSSYTVEDPDIELAAATRDGYRFMGWYSNDIASQTLNSIYFVARIDTGSIGDKDLYAGWNTVPYTISYELNGGDAQNQISYNVETPTFTINNPTKAGYDFDGWCVNNENCDTNRVQSYTVNKGSFGDLTFEAFWVDHSYTIEYELYGGSAENPTNYTTNTQTFTLNNPTKTGYNFVGWCETQNCTNPVSSYTIEQGSIGNKKLYAVWEAIVYTISYTLNGGSAVNPTEYTIETPTFILNNPTKSGYDFVGWCETQNCTNPVLSYSIERGSMGNKTLHAVWNLTGYQISYDLDGGSATNNPATYNIETPTFTLNNPTKRGYTFLGWCEGDRYCQNPQTTFSINQGSSGDKYLYAKWMAKKYVITYTCGSGGNTNTVEVVFDAAFSMAAPFCTKVGETQVDWDCAATDVYEDIENVRTTFDTGFYKIDSNSVCTAKWEENVYSIVYKDVNDNGSVFDINDLEPNQYTYAQLSANNGINITAEPPAKTGYDFIGWCTDRPRTICPEHAYVEFTPNVEPASTTIFYANWKLTTYNIEYNLNGGTNDSRNPDTYNMKTPTISLYTPTRTGYDFDGWYDNPEFDGDRINKIQQGSIGDKTLYAKWNIKTYTISYNTNGGYFPTDMYVPRSYNVEMESDIVLPEPVKTGYKLEGWYDNSNLSGEKYTVITKGSVGNLTLYANWEKKEYTIRYLCGANNITTDVVEYGGAYTVRQNVCGDKVGYEFDSWRCYEHLDDVNEYTETTTFDFESTNYWLKDFNVDCEPVWSANKYTVAFISNTGTGSKETVRCEYGEDCDITNNGEIVKAGYNFVGWGPYYNSDVTNAHIPNSENKIIVRNLTEEPNGVVRLFAVWEISSYHCEDGYYLPANATQCKKCLSGFYCPEGTWNFNPDKNQGDLSCAKLLGVASAGSNDPRSSESDCFAYCPKKTGFVTNQSYTQEETSNVCVYPATIEYVNIENAENCPASSMAYTLPADTNVVLCNVPQTREGYTFGGFRDNNNKEYIYSGSDIIVKTSKLIPSNNVVTMTGIWNANHRTITYNCNNATSTRMTREVAYHDNEFLPDVSECPNPGYTFKHWNCVGKTSNTNQELTDTIVVPDENVVCDAVWDVNKYNIVFNANTGDGSKSSVSCDYDTDCDISNNNEITKYGYKFVGWSTAANADNGVLYSPNNNNEIIVKNLTNENNATIELYAIWSIYNYRITYEIGAATLQNQNPTTYNITTTPFVLNNPELFAHTFSGWCEGSPYCSNPMPEFVFNTTENLGDKTLYAVFETVPYSITYKDIWDDKTEHIINNLSPVEYTVQDSVVYPKNIEYQHQNDSRYKFKGWSSRPDLSNTTTGFVAGTTGDKVVYAKWEIVIPKGNVIYDCGNNRRITRTDYIGNTVSPATLAECRISETPEQTFEGWDCNGDLYSPTEVIVISETDLSCTPRWNITEYLITYKDVADDGTEYVIDNLSPNKYTYQDTITYPKNVDYQHHGDSRLEYKFKGWSSRSDLANTTTGFAAGTTGDKVVYAKWTITTPKVDVVYDCVNNRKITRTDYVGFDVLPPTAEECRITDELIGWLCNGVEYAIDEHMPVQEDAITCVADIDTPKYTITYELNGGTWLNADNVKTTYTKYDSFDLPVDIEKENNNFVGWYLYPEYTGRIRNIESGTTGDITVYAKWNIKQGNIVYDCGNNRTVTRTGSIGSEVSLATATECRLGTTKILTGWLCNGVEYTLDENIIVQPEPVNCVAQLQDPEPEEEIKYNITYKDVADDGTEYVIDNLSPVEYTVKDSITYPKNVDYQHHGDSRLEYKFKGWSSRPDLANTTTGFVSGTTGDKTLYAKWTITTPKVNVVYDCGNNRRITRTDYVGFDVLPPTAEECRITTDTLKGWLCNGVEYTLDEYMPVQEEPMTCVADIEIQAYAINYEKNGGTWLNADNVKTTYTRFDSFNLPVDIEKENYDFVGWYLYPELKGRITGIESGTTGDITVYAKWKPKTVKCEAGYYLPSGTLVCKECDEENKYCPGEDYDYSESDDTGKESCPDEYPFAEIGAESVNDCYNVCPVREHYTVVGKLQKRNNSCVYTPITYHINYVLNGAEVEFDSDEDVVHEYTVESDFITPLPTLNQNGKTFVGWFDDNGTNITGIDPSLATDITLYAQLTDGPCYENYYKTSDDRCVLCPGNSYSAGGYVTTCSCNLGYEFTGTGCALKEYTITYENLKGADNSENPTRYTIEDIGTRIAALPDVKGYWFNKWTKDGETFTTITTDKLGDLVLTANWEKTVIKCEIGEYLPARSDVCEPCKEDFYCPNEEYYSYDEEEDQGAEQCPEGFEYSDNGSSSEDQCFASCPADENAISVDGVIYATGHDTCKYRYKINYQLNGGEFIGNYPTYYEYDGNADTVNLPTARKENKNFIGWYQTPDFADEPINVIYTETRKPYTLYAKWETVCESGVKLHIGDDTEMCLSTRKLSHPVMVINANSGTYYLNLSQNRSITLNSETTKKMHVEHMGRIYNVYDASME